MTVGMSAPPMGVTSMMPKISATPIMAGKRCVNSGWTTSVTIRASAAPRTDRLT